MAWGDMDYAIRGLEICLRRALEATFEDFLRWENDLGPSYEEDGYDEFTLPRQVIEDMPLEGKLAYIARLLRSLALDYGVGNDFSAVRRGGLVGEADETSLAALLRGLNDILWMPTQAPRSSKPSTE
jgi:hypothetical protein